MVVETNRNRDGDLVAVRAIARRAWRAEWMQGSPLFRATRAGATSKVAVVGVGPMSPSGAARYSSRASSEGQRALQRNSTRQSERTRPGARTEATGIRVRRKEC